jgi:oligopeptidase A
MSQKENILLTSNLEAFDVDFSKLTTDAFNEAYEVLLNQAQEEFDVALKLKNPTYQDLFKNGASEKLMALHHLLGSMNSLVENEEFRKIEEKYSGILTFKFTEWSLNSKMFKKVENFTKTKEYASLSELRQKMIQKTLKDLKSSGVNLPAKEKKHLAKLNQKIAKLAQKFQNNITDAQDQLSFVVGSKELKGLSDRSLNNANEIAKSMELKDGKYFVDQPSGLIDDIMAHSENEAIRKKIYLKRRTLASKGKYDNSNLIDQIYKLKQEVASLLGYKDYAHMALEEQMAKTPDAALQFLEKLGNIALPYAKKEAEFVSQFGQKLLNRKIEWWDHEYVANTIMKTSFQIDPESVRLYFPVDKVVNGLFELCKSMFDVDFVEVKDKKTWHSDVRYFDVYEAGNHIGGIFMDIYKRPGKTPGAWLDPLCTYENNDLEKVKPVALLVCNAPKDSGQASTFELEEVVTLFHEMGHGLHHLLSKVEEEFYSGFNNVEQDAVEIPSQLMENFVYEKDVLKKLTSHIKTGESIPDELIEKIIKSKKFMGASMIVNMVRFSEMDMRLYMQKEKHPFDVELEAMLKWKISENLDKDRRRMAVFSHIFGGGYAAGYYSYQWAEVYAADGYKYMTSGTEAQRKERIKKYKEEILYTGGKQSMKDNYALFKPSEVDLKHLINNYID